MISTCSQAEYPLTLRAAVIHSVCVCAQHDTVNGWNAGPAAFPSPGDLGVRLFFPLYFLDCSVLFYVLMASSEYTYSLPLLPLRSLLNEAVG